MSGYNVTIKIGYVFSLIVLIFLVLGFYFSGLNGVQLDIEKYNEDRYGAAAALEGMLALDATSDQLEQVSSGYEYNRRRAVIPVEYFTSKASEGGVGYRKTSSGHCYMPAVNGMKGDYGFYVVPLDSVSRNAENPREIKCTDPRGGSKFSSPALLVRKARQNPLLPVRLHIYEIQ